MKHVYSARALWLAAFLTLLTFWSAPVWAQSISSITPNTGSISGGTSVTITGSNLNGSGFAVKFDGTNATGVSRLGPTSITAVTPAHSAGTVTVT